MSTTHRIEWANALRGLAAVLVVVYHYGQAFWTRQEGSAALVRHEPLYTGTDGAPGFANALDALPVDLGGLGVALFFVLSGFVISFSVERYRRPGFFVGRVLRLIPTFTACFVVGLLVVLTVLHSPDGQGTGPSAAGVVTGAVPGLPILLDTRSISLGVDWTLIIELAFYGVCLLAYRSLTRTWVAPLVVAAACVAVQEVLGSQAARDAAPQSLDGALYLLLLVVPFLPVLLVGVVVSAVHREVLGVPALLVVPVLAGTTAYLMSTSTAVPTSGEYQASVLLAIALFLVIWRSAGSFRSNPVLRYLADISYPLYLTHALLGYALMSVLCSRGWAPVEVIGLSVVLALLVATAIHRLVELPTHRYGQVCARRAGRRPLPTTRAAPGERLLQGYP